MFLCVLSFLRISVFGLLFFYHLFCPFLIPLFVVYSFFAIFLTFKSLISSTFTHYIYFVLRSVMCLCYPRNVFMLLSLQLCRLSFGLD